MTAENAQKRGGSKSSSKKGPSSRTIALVVLAVITVPVLSQTISANQFGFEEYWSVREVTIGDIYLEVEFISATHIFGAVDRLPIMLKMSVSSLSGSSDDFTVEDVQLRGVTPKTAKVEMLDTGLPIEGYLLSPGDSISWYVTLLPEYTRKPPLQAHMSIVCVVDQLSFLLGTNAVFREPGSPDAQPLVLERVLSSPNGPELEECSWAGVKYYYSIRANYPTAAGVSSFQAVLIASFTAEHALSHGDIVINLEESDPPLETELVGCMMTVSMPLNGGELLGPGYEETLHLSITFSIDLPEQRIDYSFVALSTW